MNSFERVWEVASFIPKGKISTYGRVAKIANLHPRTVGFALNKNRNIKNVPCHRVIAENGKLSGYAFGGPKNKKILLEKEGINLAADRISIEKYLYQPDVLLSLYFELLFRFGYPGKWPWHNINKTSGEPHTSDEIAIGAILTQNTNWRNVDKALLNLKKEKANSIAAIYNLGSRNINKLKTFIRPSGFYNQKAERLFDFCKYIVKNYKTLANLFQSNKTDKLRKELLQLKGIGKETADTILLYAGGKPIFVIDAYTKRFLKANNLTYEKDYDLLADFFMKNLPADLPFPKLISLYQNYHALIVAWGKASST